MPKHFQIKEEKSTDDLLITFYYFIIEHDKLCKKSNSNILIPFTIIVLNIYNEVSRILFYFIIF